MINFWDQQLWVADYSI